MNKKARDQYDLTTGSILGKLLLVALPIMGTQLMQMTYNLTDMFWLGRLGADAVAASGTAGMFLWLSMAFMMVGRMGSEIGVSQSVGRGERDLAARYAQNSLFLGVVLGVAYGLFLALLRQPLVGFFNIREANVAADSRLYLAIVAGGIPFTFISGAITGAFNGSGNSRVPFIANTMGLVVNMILDPVLIFTAGMGISGAAIATVLAQAVVCVILLVLLKAGKSRPFEGFSFRFRPDKEHIRQIVRWTAPISVESMLFTVLSMAISRFVADYGSSALAVSRVGSQIESLSWLIGGGFGSALTAYMGQNFGAGKWDRIGRGFRISTVVMTVWGLCVTALLFFGGRALFSIFLNEPVILDMGAVYLRILSSCQLMMCLEAVSSGTFKGTGRTMEPSVISIASNTIRVPLAYALSRTSLGMHGIWIGVTLGAILRGAWSYVWYLAAERRRVEPGSTPRPS
jgi:putative MATE family efflux protein